MSDVEEVSVDEIERIIANRIKEAKELKLHEFAKDIYCKMRGWAYRFDKHGKDWVGTKYIVSVKEDTGIVEIITHDNKSYAVKEYDKKNGKEYCEYDQNNNTDVTVSNISIIYNGNVVFTTTITHTSIFYESGPYSSTTASGVLCYIPGEWLDELKSLMLNINTVEEERAKLINKAIRENPDRIKELKSKWGI